MSGSITIRPCQSHQDLEACVGIQRQAWGFDDVDLTPTAIFVVAQHTGGHTLIAFEGEKPIGFTLAFSAAHNGCAYWHSHMVAVVPEYQNHGVGRMLKQRQREDALRAGISRIEWTYDPLELRNANLNIGGLGAVVRRYIPNCYGSRAGLMDTGLPTDRFVCEWRIAGSQPRRNFSPDAIRIPLPSDLPELKKSDLSRVLGIQRELGERCTDLFARNYAVTGFLRGPEFCEYVLEPNEN